MNDLNNIEWEEVDSFLNNVCVNEGLHGVQLCIDNYVTLSFNELIILIERWTSSQKWMNNSISNLFKASRCDL